MGNPSGGHPRIKLAAIIAMRLLLGGLFLWAGLTKVNAPLQTLATIYSYQIVLPDWLASTIAAALPWMEILLGIALIAGVWMNAALVWTAAMLAAFTMVTAQAWWRELPIDCGCVDLSLLHPALAVLTTPGGAAIRNLVLLATTACLAWLLKSARPRGDAA